MKLSVFCSDRKKIELPQLRIALDEFFIEYQTVLISPHDTLDSLLPPMKQVLTSTNLYLIIPDKEDLESQWLPFVAGYSRLNKQNTILFYPETLPTWLEGFSIARKFDSLIKIIKNRTPLWNGQIKKELALTTLEERMKEHTHQNFVQAVEEGDRFMTGVFLEAGFEVNKLSADQVSLLSIAARNGYNSIIKILCDAGADINLISLDRNNTPLMDASSEGHVELVRFFIENGAELEIRSKSGQTALILASGNGQIDCAEVLIGAGADCDKVDSMGLSARKYAQLYQIKSLLDKMPPVPE